MQKKLLFIIMLTFLTVNIFALGQSEDAFLENKEETKEFVDSLGREVEVPVNIERVAPSGNLSQQIIYSLVPDKMVGWGTRPTSDMAKYFDEEIINRPVYGAFYGRKANLNMEALLVTDPQIVIDMGEIKGSKEEMIKDLDELQEKLNTPVVFIASYFADSGSTYRDLGSLLNEEEKAEERAKYCDDTLREVAQAANSIKSEEVVNIYYGTEPNGLTSYPKGNFHTQILPLIKVENIVDGSGNSIKVSPEQLLIWDPDYLIFTNEGGYDYFHSKESPFKDLKAMKNNHIYMIPEGPFNWFDRPPAINRVLGIKWLASLIYPDKYDFDIREEAKVFYKLFYHYELSDSEVDELLINATR